MNYPEDDFCGCCGRQIPGRPRFVRLWCVDCDDRKHRDEYGPGFGPDRSECPYAVCGSNEVAPAHLGSGR